MEELDTIASNVVTGLRALQSAQIQYDRDMWDISEPKFANLRHIQLHLAITVGKLARLLEPQDHRIYKGQDVEAFAPDDIRPIVADLLIHAAQMANIQALDLGDTLAARYRQNAARFAPASALTSFGADGRS